MNKTKLSVIVFLAILISFSGFFIFSHKARAAATISVYYLVTSDTTPLIKGTVGDTGVSVFVVVGENEAQEATVSEDGTWSLQYGELTPGDYAVGVAAVIGGETVSDSAYIYIEEEGYPLEFYYESEEDSLLVSSITFSDEFTYTSVEEHFSLTFPAGTVITKNGGGTFNLEEWYAEGVDPNNIRIIRKLRFGIPSVRLDFSHDVNITFNVGEEYNGQSLNIFSKSDGGDDGWEPMGVDCNVVDGSCTFSTDHASYFAITQYNSIAETEEGENDDEDDESEKAHIDSWKAYQYEDTSKSCSLRLKLIIKGKHFDEDAETKIGNHEASSVDRKSSKKIIAKFCIDKLLDNQASHKKNISVTNPDADTEEADKKINLDDIGYEMSAEDFNPQTAEGVESIQTALVKLGFLDNQYITGIYGPVTTEAVKKFQEQNWLPNTGYFGPLTKVKLQEKIK
jgi:hypothetical protein